MRVVMVRIMTMRKTWHDQQKHGSSLGRRVYDLTPEP